MKILFIKLLLFLTPLFLMLFLIEHRLSQLNNSYTVKLACIRKNAGNLKIVNLGNSQAVYGFNLISLDPHFCNVANFSQDFYYDYKILQKYFDEMNNLETVIVPVTYYSFGYDLEDSEENWRKYFYKYFLDIPNQKKSFFDIRNYSLIYAYQPEKVLQFLLNGFKVNLIAGNTPSGWYEPDEKEPPLSSNNGKKRAEEHNKQIKQANVSKNIELLNRIISLVKSKNKNVVLITLPTYREYFQNIDQSQYHLMQSIISNLIRKYNIKYYNYFNDHRFEAGDFSDLADHLNSKGAEKFAEILKNEVITH